MPIFLSPGVFPREIDLSVLPAGVGALTPAFVGTANKGPINEPTFLGNAQQAIDTFGEPFPESFLMYAVLAYFEEGARAFVVRVGVECEEGQPQELADICIDASGAREDGWGRVAVFKGIAFGEVCTKKISADNPIDLHDEAVFDISYNDSSVSPTDGPTTATLDFVGTGLSDAYAGPIDDSFLVLITSDPSAGTVEDAGFEVIRQSDGEIVLAGLLVESGTPGTSEPVSIGDGLIFAVVVSGSGPLEQNDTFTFNVEPNNRTFSFRVWGSAITPVPGTPTSFEAPIATHTSAASFADAINAISGVSAEDYQAIAQSDDTVCFRTETAGEAIQLAPTEAFALEIGQSLWVFDNPRSFLISTQPELYDITSSNNRVVMEILEAETTTVIEFSVANGIGKTAAQVGADIDSGGIQLGDRFFHSFALRVTGGDLVVVIQASAAHQFGKLELKANFTNIKTLRFAEELGILFPFTRNAEPFFDKRANLPDLGVITPSSPLSCEVDPFSDECVNDSAYFSNIVGWLVAKSPGTWVDDSRTGFTVTLEPFSAGDVADSSGRFRIRMFDNNNLEINAIDDVTFDPREDRFIANVINEGSQIGGTNGDGFVQWISRPTFLNNDPTNDPSSFENRVPMPFNFRGFTGAANGIPLDPAFSSELDRAIIGRPDTETGIFAFQNQEVFDITLLLTPGHSSGAIIGNALQMAEARGDLLYLVDPPFGLRPQQVVDWHNGMLFSDLAQAINSSFGALYFPWLKIFDQFNGAEIFIPPSGHVSSVFARTAEVAEQWFPPAGLRRGRLLTPLDTEVDLNKGERDLLYGSRNSVNPIVNFPNDGITVFGQRTLQRRASALDRVNVRMLLIFIKKNSVVLLRDFLFELNDSTTRTQVTSIMESFLADIQARRGLTGFKVVCDTTNNTPERIDRNELWVSLFLKPARAIEFIVLNLVILRTEQSFAAEEVLAAGGVVTT